MNCALCSEVKVNEEVGWEFERSAATAHQHFFFFVIKKNSSINIRYNTAHNRIHVVNYSKG